MDKAKNVGSDVYLKHLFSRKKVMIFFARALNSEYRIV